MPLTARLDLPPEDAIAFFERKGAPSRISKNPCARV